MRAVGRSRVLRANGRGYAHPRRREWTVAPLLTFNPEVVTARDCADAPIAMVSVGRAAVSLQTLRANQTMVSLRVTR